MRKKYLIKRAKELRKNMTNAEKLLWKYLKRKNLEGVKFRRQEIIGNYIVDFISYEKMLIIEVDGGQHARETIYEKRRTEFLENKGFVILRFWDNEVLKNIDGVLKVILTKIGREKMPSLNPSQREGNSPISPPLTGEIKRG